MPLRIITPVMLGPRLLGWWDARRTDLITDAGAGAVSAWADIVGGMSLAQGSAGNRPVLTANVFGNGDPGVVFDGTDDYLEIASVGSFPIGAEPCEMFVLCGNDSPVDDTATRCSFGYGNNNAQRVMFYQRSGAAQHIGRLTVGTGAASINALALTVDFIGQHVVHARIGPDYRTIALDRQQEGYTVGAVNTANTRTRMGANANATVGQYWLGSIGEILVTPELSAGEQRGIAAYLMQRRRG